MTECATHTAEAWFIIGLIVVYVGFIWWINWYALWEFKRETKRLLKR